MSELVLYGIRLLAKQFLGTVLDIEVDQSDSKGRPRDGPHGGGPELSQDLAEAGPGDVW